MSKLQEHKGFRQSWKLFGVRQSFQISRQNTWFLENNRILPKLLFRVLHYLSSIIKLQKKSVHKTQFYTNHASHRKNWKLGFHGSRIKKNNFPMKKRSECKIKRSLETGLFRRLYSAGFFKFKFINQNTRTRCITFQM